MQIPSVYLTTTFLNFPLVMLVEVLSIIVYGVLSAVNTNFVILNANLNPRECDDLVAVHHVTHEC